MAEARRGEAWDHTAMLLVALINTHRDSKKGRPAKVDDVHPFASSRKKKAGRTGLRVKPSFIAKAFGFKPQPKEE